jgi:hypothetical protein
MSESPRWTHARSGHSARRRAHVEWVLSANRTLTRRARPPTGANQAQTAALQFHRLSNGDATARPHRSPPLPRNASTRWYSPARLTFWQPRTYVPTPAAAAAQSAKTPAAILDRPKLTRGTDRPSSSVITRSAAPARRLASRTARLRSPSAVSTATANVRVGVPGRHVLCAALLGRLARAAMLPASSTVDSSLDPSSPWMRHRPRPSTTSWAVTVDPVDLFRVPPSRFQDPLCCTPHAPPEITRVGLTAKALCTPSGGCDDEPPQAHSGLRV